VITILVDHNMEGQAALLWNTLVADSWPDLVPLALATFGESGLSSRSSDREVWRFAQSRHMLLLTNNRNMDDADSLELTIREESTPASLPVLTVGNLDRINESEYRRRCAERLVDIVLDLDRHLGTGRLFIP
jgi:hypothetical protein